MKSHFKKVIATFFMFALAWGGGLGSFMVGMAQAQTTQEKTVFIDVPRTHRYFVGITYLEEKGVIKGFPDLTFKPEAYASRAEALRFILDGFRFPLDQAYQAEFSDVKGEDWFATYVAKAMALNLIERKADQPLFRPFDKVNLAEFLKMVFKAAQLKPTSTSEALLATNLPAEAWFTPFVNYALKIGLITPKADGTIDVGKSMTRAEMSDVIYLLSVLLKGKDNSFLLQRAQAEMAQIEIYITDNKMAWAKQSSKRAVEFTQQAYKNDPVNAKVLGLAKIARAYDWLVDSILLALKGDQLAAAQKANELIDKAAEASAADASVTPIASHLQEKGRELLRQVGGQEN